MKAAIVGLPGLVLTAAEAALLRAHPPAGVILFARNVADPAQLRALILAVRAALPPRAVLMVDQEGGRVARLRPPHWRGHPAAAAIGRAFAGSARGGLRAAYLTGALIGADCREAGFDVVASPVLDRGLPGADAVIGDRAFAADPRAIARLGRAFADGLLAAGVQPVMKHAPGHGRARADSHHALPVVEGDDPADLLPFALNAGLPWAMTAHILYSAWDGAAPATLSPTVIRDVIRGRIGFTGVLVSDDLAMGALSGPPEERARAALAGGCDIALHCSGEPGATEAVLAACPEAAPEALARLAAARAMAARARVALDLEAMAAERDGLLA